MVRPAQELDTAGGWPADRVERRPIDDLIPYARNARTHSEAQVAQIAASMREFGVTNPVLVDDDGTIIAGHGRVMAARRLGLESLPVMVASGWTDAQKRAYVIADNKLALNAGWDEEILAVELDELNDAGFDLDLTGFSRAELNDLIGTPHDASENDEEEGDADAIPPLPEHAVTKRGDVWLLGNHRLMCGDSTSQDDVNTLTDGTRCVLCFTSPPYSAQRVYTGESAHEWDELMRGVASAMPLTEDGQLLVNLGLVHRDCEWIPYWREWIEWMREQGWRRFGLYVWDQGPGLPGDWNGRLAPAHEFIFHFNRESVTPRKTKECVTAGRVNTGTGLRDHNGTVCGYTAAGAVVQDFKIPDSVLRVMRHKARGIEVEHPAVFPVELVTEILAAYSEERAAIYEPFSGSGTQIIGAQRIGRVCYAMEVSPVYCDLAVRRWEDFTGHEATRLSDGATFNEAQHARSKAETDVS